MLSDRRPRITHNILGFHFSCVCSCIEYKWKPCSHCCSKSKCKNHIRPVYPSEEGIYYAVERIEISPVHAQDLGTFIHEFSEAAIIQIFRRWHKDWNKDVQFDGYKGTYIAHFISCYGDNNGRCLNPATLYNKPKW